MFLHLQEIDYKILRAWSACRCLGMLASAYEVAAHMGNGVAVAEVALRMAELRNMGQLPRDTLLPPVVCPVTHHRVANDHERETAP